MLRLNLKYRISRLFSNLNKKSFLKRISLYFLIQLIAAFATQTIFFNNLLCLLFAVVLLLLKRGFDLVHMCLIHCSFVNFLMLHTFLEFYKEFELYERVLHLVFYSWSYLNYSKYINSNSKATYNNDFEKKIIKVRL